MLKYAFLIKEKVADPDDRILTCETGESLAAVCAAGDGVQAAGHVRGLRDQGFYHIDICGGFSDGELEIMRAAAERKADIRRAAYDLNGLVRLDRIGRLTNYGVIIRVGGLERPWEGVIRGRSRNIRVIAVSDMAQAKRAARKLMEKRTELIELSRWFDNLRMDAVAEAVGSNVPVGTCGPLYVYGSRPR